MQTLTPKTPIARLVALFAAAALVATLVATAIAPPANAVVSQRTSYVKSGDYRTLVTLWNTNATGVFNCPYGAKIRVLYGYGWFSKSRQEQTLNCQTDKKLEVGKWSVLAARMQIKVPTSQNVNWAYVVDGPN
jgi:hypothetical protein